MVIGNSRPRKGGLGNACFLLLAAVPAGCGDAPETAPEFSGFSWVREGKLAGMPRPGSTTDLQQDLAFLEDQGVELLFSLTEDATPADQAGAHGIELVHVPVEDFTAPTEEQLVGFIESAESSIASGKAVGVHCAAGHGRTGTFLAAWFVHEGMSADEALREIRELRPGSVETAEQEQALRDLEERLRDAGADNSSER